MRRRRRHDDEHENHERWLVSYADFITLLFAFFVVMYAISSINEGKYRVLSDAINSAFRNIPGTTSGATQSVAVPQAVPVAKPEAPPPKSDEKRQRNKERLRNMAQQLMTTLNPLVKRGQVRVIETAQGITLDIDASVLFSPGAATLDEKAVVVLANVGHILAGNDFPIAVEGHTDNVPISNDYFPSNWELSAARAACVVRLFIANGVDARLLTASGYADQRPVADNATVTGRQRNRRVSITIQSQEVDPGVNVPLDQEQGQE
ncbi:MAG TPA: flagellar motor protein MotD [Rhodocyclaceae bacterium]|jgi:chemotaxis protein MotB|nr:flagellar motor protein MotD [Rhodocyclaceae bacterium]